MAMIFVHLGPPKTGTTALQTALQRQHLHSIHYGGTHQPRRASADLSARLHELAKGVVKNDDPHIAATRHEIDAILSAGRNLMISEEMFMTPGYGTTIAQKIVRIGTILADRPRVALVSLRRPSDALPSLYQEVYPALSLRQRMRFAGFWNSEFAACFRYDHSLRHIRDAGFDSVFLLDCADLGEGMKALGGHFGLGSFEKDLVIERTNTGVTTSQGATRVLPALRLGAILDAGTTYGLARLQQGVDLLPRPIGTTIRRIPVSRARPMREGALPAEIAGPMDLIYETLLPLAHRPLTWDDPELASILSRRSTEESQMS